MDLQELMNKLGEAKDNITCYAVLQRFYQESPEKNITSLAQIMAARRLQDGEVEELNDLEEKNPDYLRYKNASERYFRFNGEIIEQTIELKEDPSFVYVSNRMDKERLEEDCKRECVK